LIAQHGATLGLMQAQSMPTLDPNEAYAAEKIDLNGEYRVLVDPRVLRECHRKMPIGQSRTSWVNQLLQDAIAQKPEALARD